MRITLLGPWLRCRVIWHAHILCVWWVRSLQLLIFNHKFLVRTIHQLALTMSPPFLQPHRLSLLPIEWSGEVFGLWRLAWYAALDITRRPLRSPFRFSFIFSFFISHFIFIYGLFLFFLFFIFLFHYTFTYNFILFLFNIVIFKMHEHTYLHLHEPLCLPIRTFILICMPIYLLYKNIYGDSSWFFLLYMNILSKQMKIILKYENIFWYAWTFIFGTNFFLFVALNYFQRMYKY